MNLSLQKSLSKENAPAATLHPFRKKRVERCWKQQMQQLSMLAVPLVWIQNGNTVNRFNSHYKMLSRTNCRTKRLLFSQRFLPNVYWFGLVEDPSMLQSNSRWGLPKGPCRKLWVHTLWTAHTEVLLHRKLGQASWSVPPRQKCWILAKAKKCYCERRWL